MHFILNDKETVKGWKNFAFDNMNSSFYSMLSIMFAESKDFGQSPHSLRQSLGNVPNQSGRSGLKNTLLHLHVCLSRPDAHVRTSLCAKLQSMLKTDGITIFFPCYIRKETSKPGNLLISIRSSLSIVCYSPQKHFFLSLFINSCKIIKDKGF